MKAITAIEISNNRKTGLVSAVWAPTNATCPKSCPLKNNGCYAEDHPAARTVARCNAGAEGKTQLELAHEEATAIRNMSGKRPLRLHVAGDFANIECTAIIDNAVAEYTAKHGQPVWAYTHNWCAIPRATFKNIGIMASCETPQQVTEARAMGYATALIVPPGETPRDVTMCRHTTHGIQCDTCKLCMHPDKLKKPIGFWPHGNRKKRVQRVVNGE